MLNVDSAVFVQVGDGSKRRVLHPGRVIGVEDEILTCEFDRKEDLSCEKDEAVFIYFEKNRTFMQQHARICSITETESKLEITLETTSDPVSADNRACYRVSTVMLDLTVAVADEEDCPLVDVSASGLSAVVSTPLKLGDEKTVRITHDGREYAGDVIVQSVRELGTGRIRHGLHCVPNRRCGGNLQQGLQVVSASTQRLLIKRMARI